MTRLKIALIGDAESPHLLKWARALSGSIDPAVELWVASSRGFAPGFDGILPTWRRLSLGVQINAAGGNVGVLKQLPVLARWLQQVDADWIAPHYLTSHGTLAWGAKLASALRGKRLRAQLVGSAWGSDILVTPKRSLAYRWLTTRVLKACALTTSDSRHMADEMHRLGAGEVMVFPFGLEQMPPPPNDKHPWRFFANRGLEPIYRPDRVLQVFKAIANVHASAELVVANDGSLRRPMEEAVLAQGLGQRVRFTGRLDATAQAREYAAATWYISLPASDSVSVSVLEAMAHGCIPILSDVPANHELVTEQSIGMVLPPDMLADPAALLLLAQQAPQIARQNRAWVQANGLFAPAVAAYLDRLAALTPPPAST